MWKLILLGNRFVCRPKWQVVRRRLEEKEFSLVAAIIIEPVWKSRNTVVFRKELLLVKEVVRRVEDLFDSYQKQPSSIPLNSMRELKQNWSPFPRLWLKMNVDVAIGNGKSSMAVVLQDSDGKALKVWTSVCPWTNPQVAETKAFREQFFWYGMKILMM
jgi:hypothetical protein